MYRIAIASRRRAGKVLTLENTGLPKKLFDIFVDDRIDYLRYKQLYPQCNIIRTNVTGIQHARNFMYDYYKVGQKIVTMCDDVKGVYKLKGIKELIRLSWPINQTAWL